MRPTARDAFLLEIQLRRERVPSFDAYPFDVPAVRSLRTRRLHPAVTFLIGENGSGKSTLLEAIAVACGFNAADRKAAGGASAAMVDGPRLRPSSGVRRHDTVPMCKVRRLERPRSMHIQFFLFALGAMAVLPTWAHAAPTSRCTRVPVAVGRDPSVTFLVGRAQPDTLLAGPGNVRHEQAPGHWGRPNKEAIFGQVVRVDRLSGSDAASLEGAFSRLGAREVIVVPWDYDPACRPVAWGRSARWVETADPGFYRLRVRPESLWVGGRPVLDAFAAALEPYPHGIFFQRGYRGTDALRTGPSLSPEEYFQLYAALPDRSEAAHDPASAASALDAWVRAHAEIAAKYPAPQVLQYTRRHLDLDRELNEEEPR